MASSKQIQQETEKRNASFAVQFPTVARVETNRGKLAGIVVKESEDRFLALFADQYRDGVYFRATVSSNQSHAVLLLTSNQWGNREV